MVIRSLASCLDGNVKVLVKLIESKYIDRALIHNRHGWSEISSFWSEVASFWSVIVMHPPGIWPNFIQELKMLNPDC